MKNRLDQELVARGLVESRSQAENYIKLGLVKLDGKLVSKPGTPVSSGHVLTLEGDQYVSRAALKLASVSGQFKLDFRGKTVLDVGSSTGGFTDYALQHGAVKVVAVDVGTNQMHPRLRANLRVELHEKTDIRDIKTLDSPPDIIVIDVSFISLRKVLPHISKLSTESSLLITMCKPQFEAGKHQVNKGVIKNSAIRRQILKDFELWLSQYNFTILDKADSQVAGTKGNLERFYKLKKHP